MHAASPFALTLAVQIHLTCAVLALLLGPLALLARKGSPAHRGWGRIWVVAMVGASLSALAIRDPRWAATGGLTPIHLLCVVALVGVAAGVRLALRGRIVAHRRTMLRTWVGACVVAGVFAFAPGRYLGDLLWHHGLGLT
ncbi:MAG: hypothetical protein RLY78_1951 [Pseudomonadota bacterium]|jgi:uncharacterized membrane protein|uniref:DUF2306 domain-containing protein n=1 Tax=Pseudaquabacterium rugosum TaxID=2984194 RepID=A0ABU9BCC0_9BURK